MPDSIERIEAFARVDHERMERQAMPEFIYADGKTPEQVAAIFSAMVERSGMALASRASVDHFAAVHARIADATYDPIARLIVSRGLPPNPIGQVLVIAAGTSDLPVAEEANGLLRFLGDSCELLCDVGVSGIHRLLSQIETLRCADVLIVVAGMEGALPSVVGGLVNAPVIAVPTSVGYGASFGGLAALLGMLNTCTPGITVVNIDNGLGAASAAHRILTRHRLSSSQRR
jgi:NCAIR mutase (PurE)-related protein